MGRTSFRLLPHDRRPDAYLWGANFEEQWDRAFELDPAFRGKLDFEFKWADNMQDEGNPMDFYVSGDVAPSGRFNYVYIAEQ